MNDDIMGLAKWSYQLELDFPFLHIYWLPSSILFVVQLKLYYLNHICKQEGLYSKVNDMANAMDTLMVYLPLDFVFHVQMSLNIPAKNVIQRGIISDNYSKLLYNVIIFKNWKKNRELVFSTIARHSLKGKKSLLPLIIVRSEVCTNC